MSNVEFDTDLDNNPRYAQQASAGAISSRNGAYGHPQSRGMAGWLVAHGIVSGDSSAKTVLIGIVCINFLAAALILYFFVLR